MHSVATLYNCCVVLFAIRNIFPHISLHDLPCHETVRNVRVECLRIKKRFCSSSRDCRFIHISVIVHNIFACLTFLFECNPNKDGQGMVTVLPNQRL